MTDDRFPNWDIDVENGTIYSLKHKRYIGAINKLGYVFVTKQKGYKHVGLHQYIWMVANGCDIPDGYDVHHIDGNPSNNSIYNLELKKRKEHLSEHKKDFLFTEEHKRKISESKIGINHYFYGKHHTDETKKKMSIKQENNKKKVIQYTLNDEIVKIWDSASECERYGYTQCTISKCCKGKIKTHKGYKWKYLNE